MGFVVNFIVVLALNVFSIEAADNKFQTYFIPQWGGDHLTVNPQGTQVQLMINQSSGAGFRSKSDYGSGLFHIRMKIPEKKTGGIVTCFFLYSVPGYGQNPGNHYELDFEFLGTNGTVQTNVYNDDMGHREQTFNLWFNPSKDFHSYDILWNPYQIVFYVDNIPIRAFKNHTAQGIKYPNTAMHIEASIWNAQWAGQVDWSQVPFVATYTDFGFSACSAPAGGSIKNCASSQYLWNQKKYWDLNPQQKQQMKTYRQKYMAYDYCSKAPLKECSLDMIV